jgi:hypothetical protein
LERDHNRPLRPNKYQEEEEATKFPFKVSRGSDVSQISVKN